MRLWHQSLVPKLPNKQLLGQHRECCALRGNGWGRKHSVVDYVFTHPFLWLAAYHTLVMNEMAKRRFIVDDTWRNPFYRGKKCEPAPQERISSFWPGSIGYNIYPEHNATYLQECLDNLSRKGFALRVE